MKPITIPKGSRVITSREESSIDQYFRDISHIKLLSAEEEVLLAKEIKCGSKEALDKLVNSNLRFVVSVAKQYQNKGVLLLDLISEGNLGLIHAAETFDESKGFRFISYAVYWIRQAILAALTEQSHMIHIPFNQFYLTSRVKKVFEEEQAKGKQVTEEEVAALFDIDLEEVQESLHQTLGYTVSLNNTISSDEDKSTLVDVIKNENAESPDSKLMEESMRKDIFGFLDKILDEREKEVIVLNYGLGRESAMAFDEIGDQMGLTKECIRQIKEKALRKLRLRRDDSFAGNLLKQYL